MGFSFLTLKSFNFKPKYFKKIKNIKKIGLKKMFFDLDEKFFESLPYHQKHCSQISSTLKYGFLRKKIFYEVRTLKKNHKSLDFIYKEMF